MGVVEGLLLVTAVVVVGGVAAALVAARRWTRSTAVWTVGGAGVGAAFLALATLPLLALDGSLVTRGDVRLHAVLGAIAGALLGSAWQPLAEADAARWAERRDVTGLDADALLLLRRFVRRSRGWRTTAVVVVWLAGIVAMAVGNALGGSPSEAARVAYAVGGWIGWPTVAVAYGLAALAVELARRGRGGRAAVLTARVVEEYVNPFARGVQRFVGYAAIAIGLVWSVSPGDLTWPRALGTLGVVLLGLLVVEVAQRRVVARPQRFDDVDLVCADDLARSSTAHALTGALVGAGLPALASVLRDASMGWSGPETWIAGSLVIAFEIVSLGLWAGFGTSYASTVTRPVPRAADVEVTA